MKYLCGIVRSCNSESTHVCAYGLLHSWVDGRYCREDTDEQKQPGRKLRTGSTWAINGQELPLLFSTEWCISIGVF